MKQGFIILNQMKLKKRLVLQKKLLEESEGEINIVKIEINSGNKLQEEA